MPSEVVPYRFLFRFSFAVRHERSMPKSGKPLLGLDARHQLPLLGETEGRKEFAAIRLAWNERGLGVACEAAGKPATGDAPIAAAEPPYALHLWFDTRNTQNVHRATRFCHHFVVSPSGVDAALPPTIHQRPLARAREQSPVANMNEARLAAEWSSGGYLLEAWLPRTILNGYDPEASPKLGFYYLLCDRLRGEQFLSVGREFPFEYDPSLWSTLELTRERRQRTPAARP
jgi:hypothetical protein